MTHIDSSAHRNHESRLTPKAAAKRKAKTCLVEAIETLTGLMKWYHRVGGPEVDEIEGVKADLVRIRRRLGNW